MPPPAPPWYRRRWTRLALTSVPLLAIAAVVAGFFIFTSVPLPEDIGAHPTVILDEEGRQIGTLQPSGTRRDVPLREVPQEVREAVLAAEDANFYAHRGVSLPGVARAVWVNVRSGEVAQGGSTISQQYIKNVTADRERSVLRKVREAVAAVKLERSYSKDQILEYYLNSIYWGRGAYGISAAARAYFDTDVRRLSLEQGALLAGLIPAPSVYDPAVNPEAAQVRYGYVLDRMATTGRLTPSEANRAEGRAPRVMRKRNVEATQAPFFVDRVETELAARLGEERIYQGLRVTTTLRRDTQAAAERAYRAGFAGIAPTGALVALDPESGGIRALVGGEDYNADQLNLALAPRQPGSTFKLFTLTAYLEQGNSPDNVFPAPASRTFDLPVGPSWTVRNYEDASYDSLSLREATWRSANTVYAQAILDTGVEAANDVAYRLGIDADLGEEPSVVLGTREVTVLELAEAYNTLAAGGLHHEATAITQVERDGRVIYRSPARADRAVPDQVAFAATDVLRGVLEDGTGRAAAIGRPAAGKTGTTQNYGNAWFAGYTPDLTTVVWMGHRNDNATMPERAEPTGGGRPAQVWAEFMSEALRDVPPRDFPEPSTESRRSTPSASPEPVSSAAAPSSEDDCPPGQVPRAFGDVVVCAAPERTASERTASEQSGRERIFEPATESVPVPSAAEPDPRPDALSRLPTRPRVQPAPATSQPTPTPTSEGLESPSATPGPSPSTTADGRQELRSP